MSELSCRIPQALCVVGPITAVPTDLSVDEALICEPVDGRLGWRGASGEPDVLFLFIALRRWEQGVVVRFDNHRLQPSGVAVPVLLLNLGDLS
jgi:hypothetical protein